MSERKISRATAGYFILAIVLVVSLFVLHAGAANTTATKTVYSGGEIYEQAQGAVFYIRSLGADGSLKATGSGFVIAKDGTAITATHVIKNADSIQVITEKGTQVAASVVRADADSDVTLLKLAGGNNWQYLTLAKQAPPTGETVYAIGYPLKTLKLMNDGIVSASSGAINGVNHLLTTIPLSNGMSGGPILDDHNEVVGLVSGTVKTMSGVSLSPTINQLNGILEN